MPRLWCSTSTRKSACWNEPYAAVLDLLHRDPGAAGVHLTAGATWLVFDFGGGTCDVALFTLQASETAALAPRLLATSRYHRIGGGDIDLPGLSKRVYNLTAYYERNGFEFRVNNRRRSDFIGEIGNFNGSRTLRYVVGESIIDAQVGYAFNEGRFKGLGLLLQVNNLTNAAYETYAGTKDRQLEYMKWGRSVLFGANYKF